MKASAKAGRMKSFLRRLLILVLFGALVSLVGAALIMQDGLSERPSPSDVAVVFGNKVERSGMPSPSLQSRLDRTVEIFRKGLVKNVLVSGGLGKEGWDEAQVMADYLAGQGIPREVIFIDSQGNNTALTARNTAVLAAQHGWKSFLLVSNFYHLPRARLAFEREGLSEVSTAYARRFVARDFYYGLLREVVAYPVYFFGGK